MSTKNAFNANSLDIIVQEADNQIQQIEKKIEYDKSLMAINTEIDTTRVYGELEDLILLGKDILKNAKYAIELDPTAEGAMSGVSSVISAVTDIVKEFTKIHLQHLRFQQQVELEKIKQKGREKLVELRQKNTEQDDQIEKGDLIMYSQEQIVEVINQ
jgi:hypothetical protein